jgi:hypothetical protein
VQAAGTGGVAGLGQLFSGVASEGPGPVEVVAAQLDGGQVGHEHGALLDRGARHRR